MPPANPQDPWPREQPTAPAPRSSWSRGARERERRDRRRRLVGTLAASSAIHLAVLTYFGMQLTGAYVLPDYYLPPQDNIPPVEAYLVPPPEPPPPPPKVAPEPQPPRPVTPRPVTQPQPEPTPTPAPRPAPPNPTLLTNRPVTAAPAPAQARAVAPVRQVPAPVFANRADTPTLTVPEPPVAAPPAPPTPAPSPAKKKEDEDQPARTAPAAPADVAPRQVAPSAPPSTQVAPLQMAPVPRPAAPAGGGGGVPRGPAGANGDFSVKPMGLAPGTLRDALRGSTVGCDNRNAVALNKGERTNCDQRVGERGAAAKALPVGTELSKDKRRDMETQADLVNRMREYKASGMPVGTGETMQDTLGQASPLTKRSRP